MRKRKTEFPERNEIRTHTEVDTHQPTATETSIRSVYSDTTKYTVHRGDNRQNRREIQGNVNKNKLLIFRNRRNRRMGQERRRRRDHPVGSGPNGSRQRSPLIIQTGQFDLNTIIFVKQE